MLTINSKTEILLIEKTILGIDQYVRTCIVIHNATKATEKEGKGDGKSNDCATEGSCRQW